ncbi:alanyl-tRNA editing protein [Methylobrevis albus]|uniref:Alanine--tRNA ligase n=1 Tax=Methylobrevis albus TaxID=2793297 RepID=A0A931I5N6_9HYPH|nr:alanyl-tRNA editing protein [Methylobrevis albus]MBH0239914.1 alanyl-tRNA editing protein [Methylobrevis albus]
MTTALLFRDDAYLPVAEATVVAADEAGVVLDRTIFYATGGGQPGDTGHLELADGSRLDVSEAVWADAEKTTVRLKLAADAAPPTVGTTVVQHLDWARRYRLMRMHTALHLLSVALPYPVTGGQIGADEGRLDFDVAEGAIDREAATAWVRAAVDADHAVTTEWITDAELEANPGLVKTMKVKPPMGSGRVRLVRIGTDVDLQPCGGTHVKSTAEVGAVHIGKIESKGKINRRVRLRFGDPA